MGTLMPAQGQAYAAGARFNPRPTFDWFRVPTRINLLMRQSTQNAGAPSKTRAYNDDDSKRCDGIHALASKQAELQSRIICVPDDWEYLHFREYNKFVVVLFDYVLFRAVIHAVWV